VIWVRVSTARALDPESPLPGIPAIIEDITEHKRAENDLHNAREALSRATRLTIMGELAASIAHEINQPLGAIIMNGNACRRFLAISPPDLDEVKDGLAEIVSDGNRASEVLSRIRGMLKNVAPERVQMDVNRAITEVLEPVHARHLYVQDQAGCLISCPRASVTRMEDPCQLPSCASSWATTMACAVASSAVEKTDPVSSGYRLPLSTWK
jgi:C4-dicarboxylate-specific signal transduction histidine kinase